jgi:hypothetical protein
MALGSSRLMREKTSSSIAAILKGWIIDPLEKGRKYMKSEKGRNGCPEAVMVKLAQPKG